MKTRSFRFARPPRSVRRAQLDNLALVPASLLPLKKQWQAVANQLPSGDVLIVMPAASPGSQRTLETAADLLRTKGFRVTTLPADRIR